VIKPDGIPVDEVTAAVKVLKKNVATLRALAQQFSDVGDGVHNTWQGLGPGEGLREGEEPPLAATLTKESGAVDGAGG
jgi:hypothetical protein